MRRYAFVAGGRTGTGTVDRLDLSDGTVRKLASNAERVIFGNDKLIVEDVNGTLPFTDVAQKLLIVDPVSMTTETTLSSVGFRSGLGIIGSTLYAQGGSAAPGDLLEVSLVSNSITDTFAVPGLLNRNLPYAFGSLWSHNSFNADWTNGTMRIYRVNPSDGTIEADISTGNSATNQVFMRDIAATDDAVYASDLQERIYKIDPDTDTITDTFNVRSELSLTNPANMSAKELTSDGSSVFFITGVGGLYKIDSSDNFTTFGASAGNGGVYYYDDRVYVSGPLFPNKTLLTAYDSSTGAEVLSYEWAGGEGGADVVVADVEGTFGIFVGAVVF
jgi:hypothetical protein